MIGIADINVKSQIVSSGYMPSAADSSPSGAGKAARRPVPHQDLFDSIGPLVASAPAVDVVAPIA